MYQLPSSTSYIYLRVCNLLHLSLGDIRKHDKLFFSFTRQEHSLFPVLKVLKNQNYLGLCGNVLDVKTLYGLPYWSCISIILLTGKINAGEQLGSQGY